ncbi:MAG: hypothetical protein FJ386_04200 [Verrucomicrobia bacterium]|nr:hypothetical protein [Verrucomicrobiota bacterium]
MSEVNAIAEMSFHGEFDHGVDLQRRLQIPADWRPTGPNAKFILLPWEYPAGFCIRVLTPAKLDHLLKEINALPNDNPRKAQLKRYIGANSSRVTLDKNGRICLPTGLSEKAGIVNSAKLVSLLDRFEIWNPERYLPVASDDQSVAPDANRYLG